MREALRHFAESLATERRDFNGLSMAHAVRGVEANRANRVRILKHIDDLKAEVEDAIARGMIEHAHEMYCDFAEAIAEWRGVDGSDPDWHIEGLKQLERLVKPLLPPRPPVSLRRALTHYRATLLRES